MKRHIPHCKVRVANAVDNIGSTGFSISWDTEEYDTDGFFDAGNPTYLTIPFSGLYLFAGCVSFLPTTTVGTFGYASLRYDAAGDGTAETLIAEECWDQIALSTTQTLNISALYYCLKGSRIYTLVQQNAGAGTDLRGDINHQSTFLTVAMIDKKWD